MEIEKLKEQIANKLRKIEEMIENKEEKNKINIERKKLDEMLEEYIKHIQKYITIIHDNSSFIRIKKFDKINKKVKKQEINYEKIKHY